jgi:rSAM/selenodomain-associated transferase 1
LNARAVVIMAKRPAAGSTKTRLVPHLSASFAAELYESFLLDTVDALTSRADCHTLIAIDESASAAYFAGVAPGVPQILQLGTTLGDRLASVMAEALSLGYSSVFAIGSDSPDLPPGHLTEAFSLLDGTSGAGEFDVVLGPSDDGGYYLIGWMQPWSAIVTEVTMSTPRVLADTRTVAGRLGARVVLAPGWYDVDEPADLERLRRSVLSGGAPALRRTAAMLTR